MKIKVLIVALMLPLCAFAQQQMPQMPPLPFDPNVRYGKLDNGLTYYIRHNDVVPNSADFYFAQNVGSILEEPEQRGLAHFLEHMAFNGLKHFPEKTMLNYFEKNGVKFGANINAYTSVEETVYNLTNIPTANAGLIDTCLLVFRDWSDGILLKENEIDKERGVIEEEWRTRDNYWMRMYEQAFPIIYKDSKYADCLPIGDIEVVRNFKPQEIHDYYNKWYRPDLQAVIIVGDIDVDYVEAKLKEVFNGCKVPENAPARTVYLVNNNKEPIIVSTTDKEATNFTIRAMFKRDVFPKELRNTQAFLINNFAENIIGLMFNERLTEITQKPNANFTYAVANHEMFLLSNTKDAWNLVALADENKVKDALETLLTENKRMAQYGFTASEYERAKLNLLAAYEKAYNERDKQRNGHYVQEYINNFTEGDAIPGIETEHQFVQMLCQSIPLEAINQAVQGYNNTKENLVIWLTGVEGWKSPATADIMNIINTVDKKQVEAIKEEVINEPLINEMPKAGSIKSEKQLANGVTHFVLSNGVNVYIKPTEFKDDQIIMNAYSQGGISNLNLQDENAPTIKALNELLAVGGLSSFNQTQLQKVLAGKNANASRSIENYVERVLANSSVKDLQTMFELVYLNFTSFRKDSDAYAVFMTQIETALKYQESNPMIEFNDSVASVVYNNNALKTRFKAEDIQKVNYGKALEIGKERFANASDFNFNIVGNVNLDSIKPLLCKYIASLPVDKTKEVWKDFNILPAKGVKEVEFTKHMVNPKTTYFNITSGKIKYTLKNKLITQVFDGIVDLVYTETVRENEGGTYGVATSSNINDAPYPNYDFSIQFDTDSAKIKDLMPIVEKQIELIAESGPKSVDLQKTKEYLAKAFTENQVENGYWLNYLLEINLTGLDLNKDYIKTLNSISEKDIKKFAQQIVNSKNHQEVVQIGVK